MANDFSLGTVEVALTPLARFEEYLQSRGKRITQQRRVLVEEVFKRHDHFDAEDLIQYLGQVVGRAASAAQRSTAPWPNWSMPACFAIWSWAVGRSTNTIMAIRSTTTCIAKSAIN